LDHGKYRYELAQRERESRKKSSAISIKEMKYRPKIGGGDFDTKTRKVGEFLAEGHKVKVTIMFRGREVAHPELGKKILDRIAEVLANSAKVEAMPKLDGRNMVMVLAPDKRSSSKAKHADDPSSAAPPAQAASTSVAAKAPVQPVDAATASSAPSPTETASADVAAAGSEIPTE
jgi:translation initiation factor IF-3